MHCGEYFPPVVMFVGSADTIATQVKAITRAVTESFIWLKFE